VFVLCDYEVGLEVLNVMLVGVRVKLRPLKLVRGLFKFFFAKQLQLLVERRERELRAQHCD